jgi:transposase
LPPAKHLIGDKGYDSDELRQALKAKRIKACIPPRSNRKVKHAFSKTMYKQRHKIECMFGKLKDWRRLATRYYRCAHIYFSAFCIAAAFIFYLK